MRLGDDDRYHRALYVARVIPKEALRAAGTTNHRFLREATLDLDLVPNDPEQREPRGTVKV